MEKDNILEFGIKRENEERRDGGCCVVFNPENKKYAVYTHPGSTVYCLYGGGFDVGEDEEEGCLRELEEESGLFDFLHVEKIDKVFTHYFNKNKNINRVALATCLLVVLKTSDKKVLKLESHENFDFAWVDSDEIFRRWDIDNNEKSYDHWIYFMKKSIQRLNDLGYL